MLGDSESVDPAKVVDKDLTIWQPFLLGLLASFSSALSHTRTKLNNGGAVLGDVGPSRWGNNLVIAAILTRIITVDFADAPVALCPDFRGDRLHPTGNVTSWAIDTGGGSRCAAGRPANMRQRWRIASSHSNGAPPLTYDQILDLRQRS